jgi:pyrroline-5-carboxylate reductase
MAPETPSLPPIAILGAGSMGGAIARGLSRSGLASRGVVTTNRSRAKAAELHGLDDVTSVALEDAPAGNTDAAAAADIVLVGVKPGMVPDLLREIAPALRPGTVVVSLAAGVTLAAFERILGGVAVLRSMPNTPALVGRGVTGLAAGSTAGEAEVALVRRLFETVGAVVEVPESQIDALSTISGSGPAYFFLLVEDFTRAAEAKGFSPAQSRLLAEQTFIGAAALLEASQDDPAELRRQVTSPKGTTERAIAVLQDARLDDVFTAATDAALARAKELAAGG